MIDSMDNSDYDIRQAFSRFFIETLSEKEKNFTPLSDEDPTVVSLKKLAIHSGLALHLKNNRIVGLTLIGEEYSSDPIFFSLGFEHIFQPLSDEKGEIQLMRFISFLNGQKGVTMASLLLDIPISKIFISFFTGNKTKKEPVEGPSKEDTL